LRKYSGQLSNKSLIVKKNLRYLNKNRYYLLVEPETNPKALSSVARAVVVKTRKTDNKKPFENTVFVYIGIFYQTKSRFYY